jgi:hypothetical protein
MTLLAPTMSRGRANFYYIGLDSKSATYNRGTGHKLPQGMLLRLAMVPVVSCQLEPDRPTHVADSDK